jgi:hypothetical protein
MIKVLEELQVCVHEAHVQLYKIQLLLLGQYVFNVGF